MKHFFTFLNLLLMFFVALPLYLHGEETASEKRQATPPPTQKFDEHAFEKTEDTAIRWLGGAGFFVNSRGTCVMIDPVLKDFDMPFLIEMPILPDAVPRLDAVFVTHDDNDHYSVTTCKELSKKSREFHSTPHVASLMKQEGFMSYGHKIDDKFEVGSIRVALTPAKHDWQNTLPDRKRDYQLEDCCGFLLKTPDGTIWAPGDSQLLPEHLTMTPPDAILFDFSDSSWHFGLENAVKLANTYPDTPLLLCHWGTVDAPEMKELN
ncbi:MAG: MBL fold metallo-hydrolase, partial [Thermoguttaceae bacterium]